MWFNPWLRRSPEGGHGSPLQYPCLENPHGQRSLAGYRPQGHKEYDMAETFSKQVVQQSDFKLAIFFTTKNTSNTNSYKQTLIKSS